MCRATHLLTCFVFAASAFSFGPPLAAAARSGAFLCGITDKDAGLCLCIAVCASRALAFLFSSTNSMLAACELIGRIKKHARNASRLRCHNSTEPSLLHFACCKTHFPFLDHCSDMSTYKAILFPFLERGRKKSKKTKVASSFPSFLPFFPFLCFPSLGCE